VLAVKIPKMSSRYVPPKPFPGEIWSQIFLHCSDPTELSKACLYLRLMCQSDFMIASWVVHRYTPAYAFMGASSWWIHKRRKDYIHVCKKSDRICPFEAKQIKIAEIMMHMKVDIATFEEFVLKEIAHMHHYHFVEWILDTTVSSSPANSPLENARESQTLIHDTHNHRARLLCEAIKENNNQLVEILATRIFDVLIDRRWGM
jgi:hypothetical protein